MVRRKGWNEERQRAVESLMDAYGPLVLRMMYAVTEDIEAAQAIYIEVFLQAYRQFVHSKRLIGGKSWTLEFSLNVFKQAFTHPEGVLQSTQEQLRRIDSERLQTVLTDWLSLSREQRVQRCDTLPADLARLDAEGVLHLRLRASQLLHATVAQVDAENRHRGPVWTKYGLLTMSFLAMAAIFYGVYRPIGRHIVSPTAPAPEKADKQGQLPASLGNLPVAVTGQFRLTSSDLSNLQLSHAAVAKNTVYLPHLDTQVDAWPSLQIRALPLSQSGGTLDSTIKDAGKIDLVPPLVVTNSTKAGVGALAWSVKQWNFQVTGAWGIAVVTWQSGAADVNTVTQIYALYLPSGKSALVKTMTSKAGTTTSNTVAVGGDKVVVQSGITNPPPATTAVNLSLDVYTLSGSSPGHAIDSVRHLSAPFGVMVSPVITDSTLVFQGIAGQPDPANAVNATWYTLSWNGQLTTYVGPPLDGQPHWAVKGISGTLWWVETTPDMTKRNNVEVLMGQLVPPGNEQQVAAQSLSQSVLRVRVTGQYVLWIQSTANTPQLVVAQVQ